MNEKVIKQLQKVSTPKFFSKDEYICYEGQPGNEMYIILKGLVSVSITNAIGTLTEIAQLKSGDFFGEMAIFDKLPRSASCIALEDTLCVSINQDNIMGFLTSCPDITAKVLESLSTRIRKLDYDLYKNPLSKADKPPLSKFGIPVEYGFSHMVKEPYQDPKFMTQSKHNCPICGIPIKITDVKRHLVKVKNINTDCRVEYLSCDPLWYDIFSCPHCCYTNYHVDFFNVNPANVERIHQLLKTEQEPIVKSNDVKRSDFDLLVLRYLQAIHLNEHIHGENQSLLGTLWLKLYWLAMDSGDDKFKKFCAKKAEEKLQLAIDYNEIKDQTSLCMLSLSLANLLEQRGLLEEAANYSLIALNCPDEVIRSCTNEFRKKLSKKVRLKL